MDEEKNRRNKITDIRRSGQGSGNGNWKGIRPREALREMTTNKTSNPSPHPFPHPFLAPPPSFTPPSLILPPTLISTLPPPHPHPLLVPSHPSLTPCSSPPILPSPPPYPPPSSFTPPFPPLSMADFRSGGYRKSAPFPSSLSLGARSPGPRSLFYLCFSFMFSYSLIFLRSPRLFVFSAREARCSWYFCNCYCYLDVIVYCVVVIVL